MGRRIKKMSIEILTKLTIIITVYSLFNLSRSDDSKRAAALKRFIMIFLDTKRKILVRMQSETKMRINIVR